MLGVAFILVLTSLTVDAVNHPDSYQDEFEFSPAQYSFEYGVKDGGLGINYGQQESRTGHVTTGR